MVKKPRFKILANDKDVTKHLQKNLISITLKDEANTKADELTIKVANKFKRPLYKDKLKLYLGYENLVFCGVFFVQSTTRFNNETLSISATSVDFSKTIKERRSITYEKLSIKDICTQIAKRNNLEVKCDLDDIYFVSVAQENESDLNFLDSLAKELNAIFNIKNHTLVFKKKIKDKKKNNELPSYTIDVNSCNNISIKHSNKILYKSCKVLWHDTKENKVMEILAGSGSPVYVYECSVKNVAEAKTKALAKLQIANQGIVSGSLSLQGQIIFAGGILNLINSPEEDDEQYQIKSVSHTFDSNGWVTSLEFQR